MAFNRKGSPESITKILNDDKKIVIGSKLALTEEELIQKEQQNKENNELENSIAKDIDMTK